MPDASSPGSADRRRLLVTTAVSAGAVILFLGPTYALFAWAISGLADASGANWLTSGTTGLVVALVAFLVSLWVVFEIVAIRLTGVEALGRGGRYATLARHVGATLVVAVGLAAVGAIAGFAVSAGGGTGSRLAGTGLPALVAVAVLGVAARFGVEFARGYGDAGE